MLRNSITSNNTDRPKINDQGRLIQAMMSNYKVQTLEDFLLTNTIIPPCNQYKSTMVAEKKIT